MDKKVKNLTRLQALEKDPIVVTALELERVDFGIDQINGEIQDIQIGATKLIDAINGLDQTKADKDDVAQQIENIARMPGRPGNPGKTPVKGVDYMTPKEIEAIKNEISSKIEIPIVDKVIERTEVIKEQPIIKTEIVKETTISENIDGTEILNRINKEDGTQIKKYKIEGLEDIERIAKANATNVKTYTGVTETRVKELINQNDVNHDTLQAVTDRGATTTNNITVNSLTETVPTLLKLNQSTPQTITNGMPIFEEGIKVGKNYTIEDNYLIATGFGDNNANGLYFFYQYIESNGELYPVWRNENELFEIIVDVTDIFVLYINGDEYDFGWGVGGIFPNDYFVNNTNAEVDYYLADSREDVTDTSVDSWNTAYGWGNHASAGYVTNTQTKTMLVDGDFYGMYLKSPVKKITIKDLGFGYTITRVVVQSYSADPTTEFAGDLKWCDAQGTGAFPSTNPTVIKVLDTTTGNYDSGVIAENVATGKELYISMDSNVDYGVMWTITITFNLKTS